MSDYSLPPFCYGILFLLALVFLKWLFTGGDEHVKPAARTTVAGGRADEYYYSEETAGGGAVVVDPNNPAHMKDYRHMDPWGLGWNDNGELHRPPEGITRLRRESLTNPNLPVHRPMGVEGAKSVKASLDRDFGRDKSFDRYFNKMIRDHERSDEVINEFRKGKR